MPRTWVPTFLPIATLLLATLPASPCSCRAAKPACAYLSADAIFLGRVSYTNDDGSGTFIQSTLVRFDVEEIFKGIPQGTRQIWVDPGSFTSCYEEYHPGKRYLIFAQRKGQMPNDTASMSIAPTTRKSIKPVPPGFDSAHPPVIYWAPECSGSRPADDFPSIDRDYAMLRAFRSGHPVPRALGYVYLDPYRGWPVLDGPALKGARITITNDETTLHSITGADGSFSLASAPTGTYRLYAYLEPFVAPNQISILIVPELGCGSSDFALRTASVLKGIVVDDAGRQVAKVPVGIDVIGKDKVQMWQETDAKGAFQFDGIPDSDIRIWYGSSRPTAGRQPWPLAYYPAARSPETATALHLLRGEVREGLIIHLQAPPKVVEIRVTVVRLDGRRIARAFVNGMLGGVYTESAKTTSEGHATLPCLKGFRYQLKAGIPNQLKTGISNAPPAMGRLYPFGMLRNRPVSVLCGDRVGRITLKLDHTERY